MRWSKQKAQVEAFFAPSISGRVELRCTRYRKADDGFGRGYITVDGVEVWNMCTFKYLAKEHVKLRTAPDRGSDMGRKQAQVRQDLEVAGVHSKSTFHGALETYCNQALATNLTSSNVLIRALAMLDVRLGKRRLARIDLAHEHEMVRYFHSLRCAAEGVKLAQDPNGKPPRL